MKLYKIVSFLLLLFIVDISNGDHNLQNIRTVSENANVTVLNNTVKHADKIIYPKKVTTLKKRRIKTVSTTTTTAIENNSTKSKSSMEYNNPSDVTDVFKNLPTDDLEFIKELDKQFKVHGKNIKIKVEHDNATDTKNSKRTIEGELGYGGYHNGYEYQRPKFAFYPYSQKDIPADAPGYYPPRTSVSIEPSYSYELNQQTYEEEAHLTGPQVDLPNKSNAHGDEYPHETHEQQYKEPVIVLRIPGSAKYATHLQTLLQQYLEIRAVQYLRILEETESRKQQQEHLQYEKPQVELQVPPPTEEQLYSHSQLDTQTNYQSEVNYAHQIASTPAPIIYPSTDDVYPGVQGRHLQPNYQHLQIQYQPQQHTAAPYYSDDQAYPSQSALEVPQSQPQHYYSHETEQYDQQHHPIQAYQNVFYLAMTAQPDYDEQSYQHTVEQEHEKQPIYVQESAHSAQDGEILPTSENSPRGTHTRVVFTRNNGQSSDENSSSYRLPSVRPHERLAPPPAPLYHQPYQQEHQHAQYQPTDTSEIDYAVPQQQQYSTSDEHKTNDDDTVSVTQPPFNYHAHSLKPRNRKRGAISTGKSAAPLSTSTTSSPNSTDKTEQQLRKIRNYVRDKLGAQTGNAVEFKTTQVVSV